MLQQVFGKRGLQAEVLCQVLQMLFNRLNRRLSNNSRYLRRETCTHR